jgi:hypothetical protein
MGRGGDSNLLYGNIRLANEKDYHSYLELVRKQKTVNSSINQFIKAQQSAESEGISPEYLEQHNRQASQFITEQMFKECEALFADHLKHHQARMSGLKKKIGRTPSVSQLVGFEKQAQNWLKDLTANAKSIRNHNLFDPIKLLTVNSDTNGDISPTLLKRSKEDDTADNLWKNSFHNNRYQTVFWRGVNSNLKDNPYADYAFNETILKEMHRLPENDLLLQQSGLKLNEYLLIDQARAVKSFLENEVEFKFTYLPHIVTDQQGVFHRNRQLSDLDKDCETFCNSSSDNSVSSDYWKQSVKQALAEKRKSRLKKEINPDSSQNKEESQITFCDKCFDKNKISSMMVKQQSSLSHLINTSDPAQVVLRIDILDSKKLLHDATSYIQATNVDQLKEMVTLENKQAINRVIALRLKEHFLKLPDDQLQELKDKLQVIKKTTEQKELVNDLLKLL